MVTRAMRRGMFLPISLLAWLLRLVEGNPVFIAVSNRFSLEHGAGSIVPAGVGVCLRPPVLVAVPAAGNRDADAITTWRFAWIFNYDYACLIPVVSLGIHLVFL